MSMPRELVLVRHGESEANVIHEAEKLGRQHPQAHAIRTRPDWAQRLSAHGEEQARIAGEWITGNICAIDDFDALYVSPFLRTNETALHLGINLNSLSWIQNKDIVERNWGLFGTMPKDEQPPHFELTEQMKKTDPLHIALDGGESLAGGVRTRLRSFIDTLHREAAGKRVLAVSHGELMWTVRYELERMLPEEFMRLEGDNAQKIRNCTILQYSAENPVDPSDVRDHLRWFRLVYPDDIDNSPNNSEWQEIPPRKRSTPVQLAERVAQFPRLLI